MAIWAEAVRLGVGYVIAPALVGSLLHELTHAAAVVATRQRLHGMNLHHLFTNQRSVVRYELRGAVEWKYAIGLAPAVLGVVAGLAYWLAAGWPAGPAGLALAVGWAFYTLQLSREDVTGRPAKDGRQSKAIEGLFIVGVGVTVLLVNYGPAQFIGYALFGGGLGLATYNIAWVIKAKQADQPTPQSGS